jgi:two-component system, NtrC family, sensor kinase
MLFLTLGADMTRPSRTGGKTSEAKARNATPAKGRKTTKTKRRIAPAATRVKRRPVSGPSKDLQDAREQQAATAEILKVIASSPSDVQPVFEAIASSANRLIGGFSTAVHRVIDDINHLVAFTPTNPESDEALKAAFPRHRSEVPPVALVEGGETAQIADAETADAQTRQLGRARGWRSVTFTPLMSQGTLIGYIACTRREAGVLADHHVQLLRTFADQAVIAIENVRLFDEVQSRTRDLEESLQFQTASSDVLKVISRSPDALQPVLDAIAETSRELCGSDAATIFLLRDEKFHFTAVSGVVAKHVEYLRANPAPINEPGSALKQLALKKHTLHYPNVMDDPELDSVRSRLGGPRALLLVPLMRDGEVLGTIVLRQSHLRPFTPWQIQAIETFADQAVIAIGNVRLFNEVQAKTADLQESLQQQTATADVLKVISRSTFDLQTVLDALTETAARLCKADMATITRKGEGGHFYHVTNHNFPPDWVKYARKHPFKSDRGTVLGRALIENRAFQVADVLADPEYTRGEQQKRAGFRTVLAVPLLREGEPIGVFILCRKTVSPFLEKQIELMSGFADQAVIAIENVRLFDEVQEALERQTATADILKVIASSPSDVQPVFEAIAERSNRLIEGLSTAVYSLVDNTLHLMAFTQTNPEADAALRATFPRPLSGASWGERIRNGESVQIPDFEATPEAADAELRQMARLRGFRSVLFVPLLRDGVTTGVIGVTRSETGTFAPNHVQLLRTFADQAVIAIGNVRLFDEVQAKTRDLTESLQQQTATADVLKVISRSAFDLDAVLATLTESATALCDSASGIIYRRVGEVYRYAASTMDVDSAYREYEQRTDIKAGRGTLIGRVALEGRAVQIADAWNDPEYTEKEAARLGGGVRAMLGVPLIHQGEPIGAFALGRKDPIPFSQRQVELVTTFADQAVIAIQNVRLFDEVQARTRELAASLDDLRAAQDRLVQTEKLASLGQLTAGIAHEIKNPLNFVNNFSALSAELTDELNDVLKPVAMDGKVRGEVDELTGMLKDNLEKVVQHGKRADSIVKNMLLHSREGSREHRPADINSLLDESLNLAYHGARAEKGEFNVTLQRNFDADAGTIELFPQEITRAFLNLIANGVYAATKRKNEDKEPGFEPTLRATTKNLGTVVEVRIRDNGTGIPAEVREKMFNPFFTTKPAGEGTGLGLSMTHDIIVKQHGGKIDVETEPGQFTEFTIVLPRKSNLSDKDRGKT